MNAQEFEALWREYENPEFERGMVAKMVALGRLPLSWQLALVGVKDMVIANQKPSRSPIAPGEGCLWPDGDGWRLLLGEADDWDTVGHELAHAVLGIPKPGSYRTLAWAAEDFIESLCDTAAFYWLGAWRAMGCPR